MRTRRTIDRIAARLRRAAVALLLASMLSVAGCGLEGVGTQADFDGLVRRAVKDYERGDSAAAERTLRTAVRMGQDPHQMYADIAVLLSRQGRPMDAVSFLSAGLKDKDLSWNPQLWQTLAEVAVQGGDTHRAKIARVEAEARANKIMDRIGGKAEVKDAPWKTAGEPFLRAGFYYLSDGVRNPAAAIRVLREALRLEPDNPVMMNALGYTLADEGRTPAEFREALDLTRDAVLRNPNWAFLDSLGWAQFKNDDLDAARRYLRQAVDLAPEQAEVRYHLGVVLAEKGETEDAKREFERALKLQPDFKKAEEALQRIKTRPGEGIVQGA